MRERCLIIGLGQIGMGYDLQLDPTKYVLSHARSFSLHPDFELIGGVDLDAKRRTDFENEYNAPTYNSLEQALEVLNPSIVVIATPSDTHFSILERVLGSSKPKAVICEKPLDENLEMASRVIEICDSKGVELFVNYIRRSEKSVIQIKEMIVNNLIQEPIKCVAWYSKGLLNNGSHMLNLLEYWIGDILEHRVINLDRSWNETDPEPDFEVSFEKGSAIFLATWEEYFPHLGIELLSPSGRLSYQNGGSQISWYPSKASLEKPRDQFLDAEAIKIPNDLDCYQLNFVNNLSLALQGKECHISTGLDALKTLKNIFKITEKEIL